MYKCKSFITKVILLIVVSGKHIQFKDYSQYPINLYVSIICIS